LVHLHLVPQILLGVRRQKKTDKMNSTKSSKSYTKQKPHQYKCF
jgi:hypothetical protein